MYKEYIELYTTYTQKYGPKTVIFLMVGSFYELYDIQNRETGETRCNVREIVDLLGIQLSHKKGDFSEEEDGLFAGFPDYVLHKWAGRLTSANYTVVIVDQIKDVKGKVKERKVSRILSPSTHVENTPSTETPYIATLYFGGQESHPPRFGAGLLDLTTGSTITYSGVTVGRPDLWTAYDLVQMLSVYPPKELVVYWHNSSMAPPPFQRLFGLSAGIPIHVRSMETLGAFGKDLVRMEYLQRIYAIRSLLPPRTYLGLRTEEEETALLYLLQFVEEHYPSMLRAFHRNESWTPQARLVCGNHALTQLQMTGPVLQETVLGLFQSCLTPMGKRSMKERLLSPYATAEEISARLNEVDHYLSWPDHLVAELDRQLRYMYDLPRLHRKLLCGIIQPAEVAGLFQTYRAMEHVMNQIVADTPLKAPFDPNTAWNTYRAVFHMHFSEEKAWNASADQTIFHPETYPEIAEVEASIQVLLSEAESLREQYTLKGGVAADAVRLEEREKEPFGLKASSSTIQQLKKRLSVLPDGTKITELKSGGWIDAPALQRLNTQLMKARERLESLVRTYLPDACQAISESGFTLWSLAEYWISHVDNTQCVGKVSRERSYVKPEIDSSSCAAYLDIEQLRHPLVEVTASRVAYVKHDVALGVTDDHKTDGAVGGWLVYGMNASGKSTLMKATGLCILLAQAGCYVPAKRMRLRPFDAIYTRILNQDNLFAGLSSFAVEMSELRDILRCATENTLVLGDELCSGTESISAQALVASGIQWLTKRRAKFIFATHLHDLPQMLDDTSQVRIWHLHVDYDPLTKKLVYDRSLRPGNGSSLYGLEVARAMDLPFEFIEQALENRRRIMGSSTQEHAIGSSWNTQITRKECELCKKPITRELEVHHIQSRASADKKGTLSDGTAMNHVSNLIAICATCHDQTHAGQITITPLLSTSDGPERPSVKEKLIQPSRTSTKWTEEETLLIEETVKKYKTLTLKSIKAQLHAKHGIQISESALGQIRRRQNDT
jgi:DNA mismatch repair protein MutS